MFACKAAQSRHCPNQYPPSQSATYQRICNCSANNFITMHQTLHFLSVIDSKIKRSHTSTPKQTSLREKQALRRPHRFPYAKAIDFDESTYQKYPAWLTQKDGFIDFMYQNYQSKLMSIPRICQKAERASDQRYFVNLYLQQIPFFKELPPVVTQLILGSLTTQYCKAGEVVHPGGVPAFLAVIFVGSVQPGKKGPAKQKNEVMLSECFYGRSHEAVACREESILLVLRQPVYQLMLARLREDIETKERDEIGDMLKSTFFAELHLKDKKARTFYRDCSIQFYFDGQTIAEAGEEVRFFYMVFRGKVQEENHIYIREHNKWPLPARKWQVRAVYNSFHKRKLLTRFDFFGDEEIISNSKFKSKYTAQGWLVLFAMPVDAFVATLSTEDVKRLKKYRTEHVDINYNEFEQNIRDKVRSYSEHRSIIKKAINGSLAHRDNLTPRKIKLISSFQKSMLSKTFFQETAKHL